MPHHRDLEAIVTVLEISAIEHTPRPGARFTKRQLFDFARELMPEAVESDMETVFAGMGRVFKRHPAGQYELR
jgi:hypothetical protein